MSDTAVLLDLSVLLPSKSLVFAGAVLMLGTTPYRLIWHPTFLIIYLGRKLGLFSL
jgi:hypothetical protein